MSYMPKSAGTPDDPLHIKLLRIVGGIILLLAFGILVGISPPHPLLVALFGH